MTVAQLINALQLLPQDFQVFLDAPGTAVHYTVDQAYVYDEGEVVLESFEDVF